MGQSPKGSSYNILGEGVPLINGPVEFGETPFSRTKRTKFTTEPTKICRAGDLILCVRGSTTGRMNIAGYDSCIGRGVASIRSEKYQDWINFFIHVNRETIYRLGSGATFPNVSGSMLAKLEIAIPPESEQKRIVAIMDEAFEGIDRAIANTEKNLANSHELFKSYLNLIFTEKGEGWQEQKIEDACESIIDCINKTAPIIDEPSPFKMIRTTNIRNGFVNLDSVKYVTEETYYKWTRRQIPKRGDVLLTREAPMGEVGMLLTDDHVFLGQRIVSYRTDSNKLNNKFLLYAFQSNDLQSQINAFASGSTVQHMRVPDTKVLRIAVPSLLIQKQVIQKLDTLRIKTQQLAVSYRQKIAALNELKQSILQKAFTGELTADTPKTVKEEIAA